MNEKLNDVIIKNKTDLSNFKETIVSEDDVIKELNDNKYISEVLFQYNINNFKKYGNMEMLAIDKLCGGGRKLYLGFNNKSNKIKFIKSYKFKNLYEMITNEIVKPYFDIDYKLPHQYITDERAKDILNRFITEFNEYFRLPITSDNIYCYAKRDDECGLIKSVHIVISGFKTTKDALKIFVNGINKQRKKDSFKMLVGGLDGKVYELRKLFSLPHQRKLGKTEYFDWFYCFDNDKIKYDDETAIYSYLINDTNGLKFNDYIDNPIEYATITENKINVKEEADDKINKIITNDEMIKLNPLNIVDKLLEHLPQEFFDNDIWKNISRQIVMNKFNGFNKWLIESAERTHEFQAETNIIWGDALNEKYATSNITKHLNLLNNTYGLCFIWDKINYFTDELIEWICKISSVSVGDFKATIKRHTEAQLKKKKPTNDIMVGNNYVFNINKQTLINEIKQSINHYGMETNFNNQYGIDESKFKTIRQDEIIDEMNMFLKSIHRISGFKMLWGSGKTYYGVDTIKKYAVENDMRILFLTENNNLNIDMTASLGGISHLAINDGSVKKQDVINASFIVSSLESLHNTIYYNDKAPFDIIVFDEYESIIHHFISKTFKQKSAFEVSVLLRELVRNANKIICLDCDLSEERMNVINNILIEDDNDDGEIQLYKCDFNSWSNYKYIIHTEFSKMRQSLFSDIFENNKRVLYSTNALVDAKAIFRECLRKARRNPINKNIMIISSEGCEYFVNGVKYDSISISDWKKDLKENNTKEAIIKLNNDIDIGKYAQKDKKLLFKNVEQTLKALQIDILVYSPSMTCGISFGNSKTEFMFDKLYGSSSIGSITAREFLQMVHRCRNLQDREINLYIKNGLTAITPFFELDVCETLILKHQQLKLWDGKSKDDEWWGNVDINKFNDDKFYRDIVVSDVYEKINSERNYIQELLGKLIINHGLNVSIKHIFKLTDNTIDNTSKDDYDEIKKLITADRKMLLQQEPKITEAQYNLFKDDKNSNDGADNRHKINKYFILNCLNVNSSNSKIMREEFGLQTEQQENGYWCVYEKKDGIDIKQEWKTRSEMMGETSGIFKNYAVDADGDTNYYNKHKVNKYFISKNLDINKQDSYWCVYVGKNDEVVNKEWKLKIDLISATNGLFTNHSMNGEIYYYGGDYCDEPIIITKNIYDSYCDIEDITHEKYDKDLLIQHSKKITDVYKSPYTERLYRLNNNLIIENIEDDDDKPKPIEMKDFKNNKLIFTKLIMDMLEIDRMDLIYRRKIFSNSELKNRFDDNALFIERDLIPFYNDIDTDKINSNIINISKYTSSNITHFKYVKDIITYYLGYIGIAHNHYNKHAKRGLYVYANDDCLTAFQYELYGKSTFINTYYDTIKNEIYYYKYKRQKIEDEIVNQTILDENIMINGKSGDWYKRRDKKFQERRNIIYKRNRYIIIVIGEVERSIKLPFNIMTANYITDKNDNVIQLDNKTNEERVEIYLKIEYEEEFENITNTKMDEYKKRTHDARYYKYNDIGWKQTENDYYVKEQVEKYSVKEKTDNIIEVGKQSTEDVVSDILNDIIGSIVLKEEFKLMVNSEINIGGEQDAIKADYNKLLNEEIDTSQTNSNDTHFNILRPNIKVC